MSETIPRTPPKNLKDLTVKMARALHQACGQVYRRPMNNSISEKNISESIQV